MYTVSSKGESLRINLASAPRFSAVTRQTGFYKYISPLEITAVIYGCSYFYKSEPQEKTGRIFNETTTLQLLSWSVFSDSGSKSRLFEIYKNEKLYLGKTVTL